MPRSWIYDRGQVTIVPVGPTDPYNGGCVGFSATAINNAGQVVGQLTGGCSHIPSPAHTYLYDYVSGEAMDLDSLGIHGVTEINDQGQLVGVDGSGTPVLFSYHPPGSVTATPLGALPGFETMTPYDLNNAGQVVGTAAAEAAAPHNRHAFIYRDGAMHDVNDLLLPNSGWVVREGWALNNRGQIVGLAWRDGRERPVLLSPGFRDVPDDHPYRDAILSLASRGIIRGYDDGRFGAADHTLRAQSAAFIARAVGWDAEDWTDLNFSDQGVVDDALWRDVRTLAHYQVALGYPDGTYNPTGEVLHQQVILFIARALIAKGTWVEQADTNPYPNLPNTTAREQADRRAVATYVHYAGAAPDRPIGQAWADWDQPSTRGWFAQVLWQALQTLPGASPAP